MITIKDETQEFIGKYLGGLSKAIVTVGFASYFFKELNLGLRIGCGVFAFILFIISVILTNNKGEEK